MNRDLLSGEYKRFPKHWDVIPFTKAFKDMTGGQTKIPKGDYLERGDIPIIDQGQDLIGGYTNEYQAVCDIRLPCVLFGDHTKIFKFITKPFALGADGVKVLSEANNIDPKFAYYFLNTLNLPDVGYSRHFRFLKRTFFPLPPLEEQRRIAAILDKADGVRRKRKEAIRLTEELLKSTFLEMFGDPVTNPKGWEVRELGDCVKDIESGWSPKCDTRQAEPEEWGVLKLGAVTYGHFNPDENKAMLPDDVPRQELEIKTGDLLVTRKNTYELVGASAFVQMTRPKLMLPDLIFRLRLIDGIDPVYVWQTLSQKTMRLKLSGLAGGTAGSMPNISKARLRTLPFPVPPQLLQLKYREIFNQFWLKKEHQKESEEISENLFNSLLQKAFRGEL
ncbi:MAG: restriction endonuclease subunit S [Microcystis sp.]|jgi:type I restriction enzyme S subunit|uniref:restriction endonuclease subunit S n=2 Tax=Microcystis sp. TaxID=1127 RepID=UPI0022BCE67F|nr:restriction endonuclease subunit S [Microcystis sp. LE17-20D]MCZ8066004.1 restriction endonuclease subunit S [Microcystis sp. LE17-20D]MCZ8160989.1 restriction endonuclease subunit S [Microcystis sp. LE19-196.1B]MCZ8276022.1 restriction endonuclease subunit S [Microcystis sp. LE19-4.1E]